jgi:hypothetical protein
MQAYYIVCLHYYFYEVKGGITMANNKKPTPLVTNLTMTFRKATTTVSDDVAEVKKGHRENIKLLIDNYMSDVHNGNATGISSVKELVDVIKLDLLMVGEATERPETTVLDEIRVSKIAQVLDENDPAVQAIMGSLLKSLNEANDEADQISPSSGENA